MISLCNDGSSGGVPCGFILTKDTPYPDRQQEADKRDTYHERVINIIVIDLPSWLMGDFAMIRWRMIDDNGIITNSSVDRRDEILCRVDKH